MEIPALQVFVSLMLGGGSLLLFWFTCRQRDFDHADRLALLPIEEDKPAPPRSDEKQPPEKLEADHG